MNPSYLLMIVPTLFSHQFQQARKQTDATIYYEVPAEAKDIELEYEADYWSDEKFIFIVE